MRLDRFLPQRLRNLAPEAIAFGLIGIGNFLLYELIYNGLIFIGAVKSTVIATLVTTYLAYLANRHWTYKDRPRRALRREYTLFFGVNLVGMLIQAAGNALVKYGFGMSERGHWLAFNVATGVCICLATLFRFWTYRTFVFVDAPATALAAGAESEELPVLAPAEGLPIHVPAHRGGTGGAAGGVESELAELEFDELTGPLEAELTVDGKPANIR